MDLKTITIDYFKENEDVCVNYVKEHLDEVPYVNALRVEELKNESLVRFRGMVQDMHSAEYYLEKCEVKNNDTGAVRFISAKYKDVIECGEKETIEQFSDENVMKERQVLVVTTVPGLSKWVEQFEKSKYGNNPEPLPDINKPKGSKRSLEVEEERGKKSAKKTSTIIKPQTEREFLIEMCRKAQDDSRFGPHYKLNLPLPDKGGKACIIKLYQSEIDVKVNEVFDFVGFVALDPRVIDTKQNPLFEDDGIEIIAHNPPPSLSPRIHVIYKNRLNHVNPLVGINTNVDVEKATMLSKELKLIFTEMLLGDSLAGSYLFYHLISTIYLRKDLSVLGKFSLNLMNIPAHVRENFGKNIHDVIEMLTTHSYYIPLSLQTLGKLIYIPEKCTERNILKSGVLQLADNTHLVLDETKLTVGFLHHKALQTLSALKRLIKEQVISYNFDVYKVDFDHNIPVLTISEGKTVLATDYRVRLIPNDVHVDTYNEVFQVAKMLLTEELLNDLRQHLTVARHKKHEISQDIESLIEEDFANFRQKYDINGNDLHRLIVLARLVAFGDGKTSIDSNSWKIACDMEEERWLRIKSNSFIR